ncbi:uncharacterized protein CcaverHIS019_0112600 [Cutaneotrichosporon cavernicola]|uniref:Uncharacterized protein n=1 Tax=Cutaneotrichosporon cavernicola TaxID=279322 RepID=A0AA48I389_9TREE|nr:uncharacterized protein CcaverHIS019_0112600 [Cutaneotrichosporon cavernicola]BEI88542.1 hypothetical protein CcaverHIS019_0112600 [Cutaneotrichosporon cavernicola]BEI96315.1 hypothetical protein CcaverHIS631_0112640 [Cutaneotrichosporon cavernicola]BEJ04086.1 hypothetical protein CcaverHIS641_0112610 [Cutaneotrichosporon cavernicola]
MRVLLLAVLFGSALVGAMPVDAAYDAAHAEHRPAEHPPAKPDMPQPQVEPQPQPQPQPQPVEPVVASKPADPSLMQTPLLAPLRWSTPFPDVIEASTNLPLSWTGGDASFGFEVYFIPIWPGQHQYDLHTITNTTAQNTVWNVPDYEDFPEDTTFILGVKDSTGGPGGGWYDLTSPLLFVNLLNA